MLEGRTTILVTQIPWIPEQADMAITLERGRIKNIEKNISPIRQPIQIAEFLGGNDEEDDATVQPQLTAQQNGKPTDTSGTISKAKASDDLIEQETKASGKIGRLTCK